MEDPPLASGIDSSRGVSPKVGIITQASSVYIYWSFHSNFGESSLRKTTAFRQQPQQTILALLFRRQKVQLGISRIKQSNQNQYKLYAENNGKGKTLCLQWFNDIRFICRKIYYDEKLKKTGRRREKAGR